MKVPIFLITLAILTSCQRPIPPAQANEVRYQTAANVNAKPSRIEAGFEGNVWAAIYTAGGASIAMPGKPQYEIEGATFPDVDGSLICSDNVTGDYLHLFPKSGRATVKIGGRVFYLMPENKAMSAR